ncbi:tRNA1(Val) (adenine(37)-N6)-methyltransferase [Chitinophaga caseinilytica]|uniref:tRNA1(Val) (adenine(37)-N6)-methyltransferase n=1 Tax=Chitinophaga caseinilytica TaxID=2267521 RepID=UPI003C2F4DC5
MGNSWFQFKQFRVEQAGSAMKVCTDACIQGAWTAASLQSRPPARVLDIGTGTGLLSLMLAQVTPAIIDAVELDTAAAAQAIANFAGSPWNTRLHGLQSDIRTFSSPETYDFIITNPPFFQNDLRGPDARRTAAMHTATLGYADLLDAIARLLSPGGSFSILLPYPEFRIFQELANAQGHSLRALLDIQQSPAHAPFRSVGIFGKGDAQPAETLVIHDEHRQYTPAFSALLQPFYLYL